MKSIASQAQERQPSHESADAAVQLASGSQYTGMEYGHAPDSLDANAAEQQVPSTYSSDSSKHSSDSLLPQNPNTNDAAIARPEQDQAREHGLVTDTYALSVAQPRFSLGAVRQRYIEAKQSRQARMFTTPRMNPLFGTIPAEHHPFATPFAQQHYFLNTETICDVVSAICLMRTVLVFRGQAAAMSRSSLGDFLVVFVPFDVFIYQVMHMHDHMFAKPDMTHTLYTFIRLVLVLGLSWFAPSVFISADDTLDGFIVLLVGGKTLLSMSHIAVAAFDAAWASALILKAVYLFAPVVCWIIALNMPNRSQTVLFLALGAVLDVLSTIGMDYVDVWFEQRRERMRLVRLEQVDLGIAAHQRGPSRLPYLSDAASVVHYEKDYRNFLWMQQSTSRLVVHTAAFIASGIFYILPIRPGASYPDLIVCIKFSILNLLAGGAGVVILFSIHSLYAVVFGWRIVRNIQPSHSTARGQPHGGAPDGRVAHMPESQSDQQEAQHQHTLLVNRRLQEYRRGMIVKKMLAWLHLPLHACIAITVAGMQQQLESIFLYFYGLPGPTPRLPIDMSIGFNLTVVQYATGTTGIAYLSSIITNLAASPLNAGTSRFVGASWLPISLLYSGSGLCVIVMSIIGALSVTSTILDESHAQGIRFLWAMVRKRIGLTTIVRLLFAAILLINGLCGISHALIDDTWSFFILAGALFGMCIVEEGRRIMSQKHA